MLDDLHDLDDDRPFVPDDAFRARVRRRGRSLRRRRRSLAGGAVLTPLVLVGAAVAWARGRLADVDRVDLDVQGPAVVDRAPDGPVDVLVVGTDGGLFADSPGHDGAVRADAVALVRLDPERQQVRVLSLPRDLWLPGDGIGDRRLAAVRATDGPEGLLEVVEDVAVPGDTPEVDAYVELDAAGLAEVVDLTGGVTVRLAAPVRDRSTGLDEDRGCRTLDGEAAGALARSRYLEVQHPDGSWAMDPSSDAGRIRRAQVLGQALARAVLAANPTPTSLVAYLDLAADHVLLDGETALTELAALAEWARSLPDGAVEVRTLPVEAALSPEGASILLPTAEAGAITRWLVDGNHTDPVPSAMDVPSPAGEGVVALAPTGACG